MSKDSIEYLRHIQDKCEYIISVIQDRKVSKKDFFDNETLKRAIVRSLEIIGEATKKIPVDEKLKFSTIQWKNMAGMRDKLIHDYMGVNYSIVWDVVINKIPDVLIQIKKINNKNC